MSLGKARLATIAALSLAAVVLPGTAATASAATVSVDRPCYIEKDGRGADIHPLTIAVAASGLPPGRFVSIKLLGGERWGDYHYQLHEVSADGSVSMVFEHMLTETPAPVAEAHTLQVVGISGEEPVYAETTVWMAHYGMRVSDTHTRDGERVRFQFAGLAPERPVYAHYIARGKEVFSHKMGVTSAPCGALETTGELFPAKHSRFNRYVVQFDQKKKYSPKTRPRFRHGLRTGRY